MQAGVFAARGRRSGDRELCAAGEESRKRLGSFLAHSQFQTSSHSSGLYLTGAAQNLLCLKLVSDVIGPVGNPFVTWLWGASVPALCGATIPEPKCDQSVT